MLTKNEISALNLSPTKKDFVQIWNELLEVAGKLSERWDPTSTNESDPGIVILKALTGIADKLNYNIDKNTLEAFMPTAAQEDSMRKLCDMLGYNVKYYRSAEAEVTIKYRPVEDEKAIEAPGLLIPKFTVITNGDQDINYFTTNAYGIYISSQNPSVKLSCMEGQLVKCESINDNNVITASQISEQNRFYLPEYQIAENGIFVYNVGLDMSDGTPWKKVENLNIQARGERVYKFGYDSYEARPYLEFPEDYSELINDGLFIYYARTSGANGNISARVLSQLEFPSSDGWSEVSPDSFTVENTFAATTGTNIETINQAYNSFKKTVGTFETLVTCRDYMNKIYTMISDTTGKPLVSNILATDIRTDLNRAVTICSCDDAGIFYKDTPLTTTVDKVVTQKDTTNTFTIEDTVPAIDHFDLVFYPYKSYNQIRGNVKDIQADYDASFKYDNQSFELINSKLNNLGIKTIAHKIRAPRKGDIISINNYLKLNAVIGTTAKISTEEGTLLKEAIKIALANAFNMRELDFGEEIPFESIVDVIEKADSRIKVVSLAEPALYTTYSVLDSYTDNDITPVIREYAVASAWLTEVDATKTGRFEYKISKDNTAYTFDTSEAKKIYNKLAVRNVLAGRVPLFKYNTTFSSSFAEGAYRVTKPLTEDEYNGLSDELKTILTPSATNPSTVYVVDDVTYTGQYISDTETIYSKTYTPTEYVNNFITSGAGDKITEIKTELKINADDNKKISNVTLATNEVIKFRAPNFTTVKTYPAYVNYHLALNKELADGGDAQYAEAYSLYKLLVTDSTVTPDILEGRRDAVLNATKLSSYKKTLTLSQTVYASTKNSSEDFSVKIDNQISTAETPDQILAKSGFIKLKSGIAKLTTGTGDMLDDTVVNTIAIPEIFLSSSEVTTDSTKSSTSYILTVDALNGIKGIADNRLKQLAQLAALPPEDPEEFTWPDYDWQISYEFEYIPFELATLSAWETFLLKDCDEALFGFSPVTDYGTVIWRVYNHEYPKGKYILPNSSKLLPFTSSYFNSLDANNYLDSVYVAESLGKDKVANIIENGTEYRLREGDYLYIEYTPSTTTEDGTSQTQKSVTEVYGKDTIIRPSGFEGSLIDSSISDKSSHKNITFEGVGPVAMYSLGASEQIEIRDFSRVVLNKEKLGDAMSKIYVYKNFNCDTLEGISTDGSSYESGKRTNSTYTLKDGEYIFYTDQNKSEFAYFTTGTEVTLTGGLKLIPQDTIDLATIFDSGIDAIPWGTAIDLNQDRGIIFQEFQYITLAKGDTLNSLTLLEDNSLNGEDNSLNSSWQRCDNVEYTPAGGTEIGLSRVNISDSANSGNGWEVCSILDLSVSPNSAQTLRKTEAVETTIQLVKENTLNPVVITAKEGYPLSFKTNLACQATNSSLPITNVYSNPNKLESFEVKVFSEDMPAVVKTVKGSLMPYIDSDNRSASSAASWDVEGEKLTISEFGTIWKPVALSSLAPVSKTVEIKDNSAEEPSTEVAQTEDNSTKQKTLEYDRALRLSVVTLPNTYGIFSIYLNYRNTANAAQNKTTWIELLPGADTDAVELFNVGSTWNGSKLTLNEGINCIRVKKTTDIFIKTAAEDGALYFDNLRLVECASGTQGINLGQIGYLNTTSTNLTTAQLEQKLLEEIRKIDTNRDFYYNVPIESNYAIDFNEGDATLNTLMNPATNYDINNINNNFVISKIDINYLNSGLQIARSSKLN